MLHERSQNKFCYYITWKPNNNLWGMFCGVVTDVVHNILVHLRRHFKDISFNDFLKKKKIFCYEKHDFYVLGCYHSNVR